MRQPENKWQGKRLRTSCINNSSNANGLNSIQIGFQKKSKEMQFMSETVYVSRQKKMLKVKECKKVKHAVPSSWCAYLISERAGIEQRSIWQMKKEISWWQSVSSTGTTFCVPIDNLNLEKEKMDKTKTYRQIYYHN